MTKGWTEERRQKARERILQNKPWEKSTGPKTVSGKQKSAINALKHGERSRIWREYSEKIINLNNISLNLVWEAHEFKCQYALMTNELIKKSNKNKEEGPHPHTKIPTN